MNPFVTSRQIEPVIAMSRLYNCRPSDVINIEDEYTAYCFNEACALIIIRMQNGEKPEYGKNRFEKNEKTHYTNFSDLYKNY